MGLFVAEINATLGQVIRCHFHLNLVTSQNTNAVFAHFACCVGDNFMTVFQLYPKCGIGQKLYNDTIEFEKFFFSHVVSVLFTGAVISPIEGHMRLILRNIKRKGGFYGVLLGLKM
tara:strand:- start:785 stop:1132 length:348 start_codon:yes stop_codon:yes gene_type:complete